MSHSSNDPYQVTCECQHCAQRIQFDSASFGAGETRAVDCPHCGILTHLYVPTGADTVFTRKNAGNTPPPASAPSQQQAAGWFIPSPIAPPVHPGIRPKP